MQLIVNITKPYMTNPPSVFFNDLGGPMAERRPSFRDQNQLALVPSPLNMFAAWPNPTAQGLGESRVCWDGVRMGVGGYVGGWLALCHLA